MKLVGSLSLLLLSITSSLSSHVDTAISTYLMMNHETGFEHELLMARFEVWVDEHAKEYDSEDEAWNRMQIWLKNDAIMEEHKLTKATYELAHNQFSDMTLDEFHAMYNLGKKNRRPIPKNTVANEQVAAKISRSLRSPLSLPDYVNWVQMGGVTDVKNQGSCGSCWAFSTTGALEGAKFVKTGELVALSEQNLLDCDHLDMGCNGGLMDDAFKFDEKSGGLCSEADYPYEAVVHGTCNTACTDVPGSIVKTFVDVPPGDERALLAAVAMQPISVAVQADQLAFQFYSRGVLTDETCGEHAQIDHGVLAVGYGTDLETQVPYWLVKNSWGDSWGESGYFRLARNSSNEFGMCAILKMSSFPIVE